MPARIIPAFVAGASALILIAALGFQYIGELAPCPLCLWQRWPHVAALFLGAAAVGAFSHRLSAALTALAAVALSVGVGLAVFHVGVEQHWWAGTSACAGTLGSADSLSAILEQAQSRVPARCDEVPWSLFGLSMAAYNAILSLALAGLAAWGAAKIARTRNA